MAKRDRLTEAFGAYEEFRTLTGEKHPQNTGTDSAVPVTDGTPAPSRQKNAEEFLAGNVPGVMAQYASGMFGCQQHTHSPDPAPVDETALENLAAWREEAEY